MSELTITAPEEDQYEEILALFNEAFLPKFRYISRFPELNTDFAHDFGLVNLNRSGLEYVALEGGTVLGFLSLKTCKKERYSPNLGTGKLIRKYGIAGVTKAFLLAIFMDSYRPPKGELYIAAVGVSSQARGRGVGTALLNKAREKAVKEGYACLSLEVMHENDRAKALYERLRFVTRSFHAFAWLQKTTGYSGSYLMKQEL